jgi:ketosteroid isomerase-like protein
MSRRAREHVERFNAAAGSGDWTRFVAAFTDDAVMSFAGAPAGPYAGRAAIARAYAQRPPADTMTVTSVRADGDTDLVRFAWDAGGTGTMTIRWRDGRVAALEVAFD